MKNLANQGKIIVVILAITIIVILINKIFRYLSERSSERPRVPAVWSPGTRVFKNEEKVYPKRRANSGTVLMSFLRIQELDTTGEPVKEKEVTMMPGTGFYIGCSRECDFHINQPWVSTKHAVIATDKKGYFLKDLNSTNGTWKDGKKINQLDLPPNCDLKVYIASVPIRITWHLPFTDAASLSQRVGGSGSTRILSTMDEP